MNGEKKETLRVVRAASRAGGRLLAKLAGRGRGVLDPKLTAAARRIVRQVRRRGDDALLAYARDLDGATASTPAELMLWPPRLDDEVPRVSRQVRAALEEAIRRVERFHRPQVGRSFELGEVGGELAERVRPLARVGVYVPGGRAVYPSTVVMTVVPARLAGVREIVVATPPKAYREHAVLRWVLARLGVTEVWGLGGAQAVAALAYGTETLERVDKIVGPGNAWVTAAKREVIGDVAIDGFAGPSEVVIVADGEADARLLAADLLAQAEHDPMAAAVLITRSRSLAERVEAELEAQLADLSTAETARAALAAYGACFLVGSTEEALAVAERLAPEHLQLIGPEAEALAERVGNAGAVFVGAASGEVLGDYVAGPSHVLPTGGSARFASGLGVADFERHSHLVRLEPALAARLAIHAETLAVAEGFPAHARAAALRKVLGEGAMSVLASARPELVALPTYGLELAECRFKLDQNEMPWDLPAEVKGAIGRRLAALDFSLYPSFHGETLAEALAVYHRVDPAGVLVGNGSNELLAAALTFFGGPGAEVLALAPCFSLYRGMAMSGGARLRVLGPRPNLALPLEELLAAVAANPRRPLLLTTPNNPTGEAVPPELVERLLETLEAPLLLDNAYGEFCRFDYRPLLARFPHLLLFRTFSKAWSLAAVRLGYLLTSPGVVELLKKVKLPYNLGAPSVVAGEECLAAAPLFEERVRRVIALRPLWAEGLKARGFEVWPSEANFLLVRCPGGEAKRVWQGLAARSLRVRDVSSGAGLAGCLRISIGHEAALDATLQALDEIFQEEP